MCFALCQGYVLHSVQCVVNIVVGPIYHEGIFPLVPRDWVRNCLLKCPSAVAHCLDRGGILIALFGRRRLGSHGPIWWCDLVFTVACVWFRIRERRRWEIFWGGHAFRVFDHELLELLEQFFVASVATVSELYGLGKLACHVLVKEDFFLEFGFNPLDLVSLLADLFL